ncbi:MAG TPA: isochorismatase family protein [Aliidongia sp.]|nr:isochorismatase family protein [Aliidongia sp.]
MVEPLLTHNRFAERLRADDTALAIVDAQTGLLSTAAGPNGTAEALRNNLLGLARLARAFSVPTVLGAGAKGGPVLDELLALFGPGAVVPRIGGGFWDDPASRKSVLASGRHHLIIASLTPDFGLAATALGARRSGLEVHAVLDASTGSDDGGERVGIARMTGAGIHLTSWVAVLAELAATGAGGNGAAAVRDNLDRYATGAGATSWGEALALSVPGR